MTLNTVQMEILGMSQQAINVRKQCCSDNNVDRNSLIVFVCYLTPFCFFVFRSLAHNQNEVSILTMYVLENVEHCGGEPERADTGIFMSLMSG